MSPKLDPTSIEKRYRVEPGSNIRLDEWDSSDSAGFDGGKEDGRRYLTKLNQQLEILQELLFNQRRLSPAFIAVQSKRLLGEVLGGRKVAAALAAPGEPDVPPEER